MSWGILGRIGGGIKRSIDDAAYNALGGGLLGDALMPQQMPQTGLLASGDPGSGEAPEYSGGPPGGQQQAQAVQPGPPQQWQPDPRQRAQLRGQYLTSLGGAFSRAGAGAPLDLSGALQEYQRNAVGQIQAGQQQKLAQQKLQMRMQFQQDVKAAAGDPVRLQAVLNQWAVYFPQEAKDIGENYKLFKPDPNKATGKPYAATDAKGNPIMQIMTENTTPVTIPGITPPKPNLSSAGDRVYAPDSGMTDTYAVMMDNKPANVRQEIRTGKFFGADGKEIDLTKHTITPYAKPEKEEKKQRDDRAIEIFAKPPNQRTKEENDYLVGYNRYVDLNKIQPGLQRTQLFVNNKPFGYIDPDDPLSVVYGTGAGVMGKRAPASIDYQTAKAVAKDATSGPTSRVLNNINTAYDHTTQFFPIIDALGNGNLAVINQAKQWYERQTGQAAPASLQLVKTALIGEAGKAFTNGALTIDEAHQIGDAMRNSDSPQSLKKVAQDLMNLMASKRHNIHMQVDAGMQGKPYYGDKPEAPRPQQGGTVRYIDNGTPYTIPAEEEAAFLSDHPKARRL